MTTVDTYPCPGGCGLDIAVGRKACSRCAHQLAAGLLSATPALDDGPPYWVELNTDPPRPPYGSPERAAYDAQDAGNG